MVSKIKIRHQILIIFLITGLLPMLFIGSIAYWGAAETLRQENFLKMEAFNGLIEERFDQYFHEQQLNGAVISELYSVVNALQTHRDHPEDELLLQDSYAALDVRLERLSEQLKIPLIFITDKQGIAIYATNLHKEAIEGTDLSYRTYIQRALTGNQNWSNLFDSDVIVEYVVVLSTPVRDSFNGQILGTVNVLIRIENLQSMLHDRINLIGKTGDAYLVNADGLLLTNTTMEGYREGVAMHLTVETEAVQMLQEPIQKKMLDFVGTGHYSDYRGEKVLGSFGVTSLGGDVVGIITEIDDAEVLAPLYHLLRLILGITLFMAMISTVAVLMIGQKVETIIFKNQTDFKLLAESTPVGVLLYDEKQQVIYMNPRIKELFGYTLADIPTADDWWPLAYPDEVLRKQVQDHWQKEITAAREENREMNPLEYPVTCKDGQVKQIEFRAASTGKTNVVVMMDVTQRKNEQVELLEAKQKAEIAALAKSQFLANMSHEIRTPMNGMLGMLQLIGLTQIDDEQQEYLENAQQASQMLIKIINDILDYSKIEAGRIQLENQPFSVNKVVVEICQFFIPLAKEKSLTFTCSCAENIPNQLLGDVFRLKQVLNNLIGNAVKFTAKGGIHLEVNKIAEDDDEVTLQWVVEDTGIGINVGQLGEIFHSFTQADSSHTRRYGGTGLGLAISKSIVEHMGGEIWTESQEGVGSKFYFTCQLNK